MDAIPFKTHAASCRIVSFECCNHQSLWTSSLDILDTVTTMVCFCFVACAWPISLALAAVQTSSLCQSYCCMSISNRLVSQCFDILHTCNEFLVSQTLSVIAQSVLTTLLLCAGSAMCRLYLTGAAVVSGQQPLEMVQCISACILFSSFSAMFSQHCLLIQVEQCADYALQELLSFLVNS